MEIHKGMQGFPPEVCVVGPPSGHKTELMRRALGHLALRRVVGRSYLGVANLSPK